MRYCFSDDGAKVVNMCFEQLLIIAIATISITLFEYYYGVQIQYTTHTNEISCIQQVVCRILVDIKSKIPFDIVE